MSRWEADVLRPHLLKRPETRAKFRTGSGEFEVKRLYTPADVASLDYLQDLGFPGQFPFTRGVAAAGYRNHEWRLDFYSGHGSSADTNAWYRRLIAQGATFIRLAMDLPTQVGLDPDHPLARGEVGRVGVAVSSLRDMERIFDGISLERVWSGTVGNCIGVYAVSLFQALAERQGIDPSHTRIVLQNDPLKEYTGRGTFIFPIGVALDLAADVVEYCWRYLPHWIPQYACTTQMRWGGVTAAEEIGYGIAHLMTYIERCLARSIPLEALVPKLDLHMTADNDVFEEVAKFRATRRLWAKLMRERFGTDDPRVLGLRISVFTAANRLTAQQPMNNIVRTTLHVLAAILGGVQRISVPAHDEAWGLPTIESTRLANMVKHIIHHESGVAQTVDPLGGSYFVEALTNELEESGRRHFETVESLGGPVAAIESGYYDRVMAEGLFRYHKEIETGERVVVGVNRFTTDQEPTIQLFEPNEAAESAQVEAVRRLRAERDSQAVRRSLDAVRRAAEDRMSGQRVNLVPPVLRAVREYATVGEIFGELREVFGEYKRA